MNLGYMSMREAADFAVVDVRTIQRHVKADRLRWHGENRRGRYAAGIDREELKRLVSKDGGQPTRARKMPAWKRIERNLTHLENSADDILLQLFRAIEGGACLDLSHLGIREVCKGHCVFIQTLMGDDPKKTTSIDALTYRAALQLRHFAEISRYTPQLPSRLRHKLAMLSFFWKAVAKPEVEPVIRFNEANRKARLDLSPRWMIGSQIPRMASAYHQGSGGEEQPGDSVVTLKHTDFRNRANRLINRVVSHLEKRKNRKLTTDELREELTMFIRFDEWFDDTRFYEQRDGIISGSGAKTQIEKELEQNYGLSTEQIFFLRYAVRGIRGDALDRLYIERKDQDADRKPKLEQKMDSHAYAEYQRRQRLEGDSPTSQMLEAHEVYGLRSTYQTIGDMFGISRQIAAKWLVDGRELFAKMKRAEDLSD
jgi:hypothetical protein